MRCLRADVQYLAANGKAQEVEEHLLLSRAVFRSVTVGLLDVSKLCSVLMSIDRKRAADSRTVD